VTTVFAGRPITDAIISALTSVALIVGDGVQPKNNPPSQPVGWQGAPGVSTFGPYVVAYPLLGGSLDGPLGDPDADAEPVYQITSVGGSRQQCEWVADKVRAVMLGGALLLTVGDRRVVRVSPDVLPGATREDDSQPSIWFAPERFRLYVTPA
jgi:hypothetical protein